MAREDLVRVGAVTMVKDEADVLAYTLRHMRAQHVDVIGILDNLSTDGTRDIIEEFIASCDSCLAFVLDDDDPAYYQAQKMSHLANHVHDQHDVDWVIPFDADELWHTVRGEPLGDYLRDLPLKFDRVDAKLFNHFPCSTDNDDSNPFVRIVHRDQVPAPLPKVCLRWNSASFIHQGNHGGDGWTKRARNDVIVRHFPWRSYTQFERKVRNGAAAYAATTLPEAVGGHWRSYGQILDQGGDLLRTDVWDKWFCDPTEVALVDDPAPYRENP